VSKVILTLVKSTAKRAPIQKATLVDLGMGKTNNSVEKEVTAAIQGMINKVKHI